MATERGITTVAPAQTDKSTTINNALQSLEDMANATHTYTVTATFTVDATDGGEWSDNFRFLLNGTPGVVFNMRLPAESRFFMVDNDSGSAATVGVDPGEDGFDGTTVTLVDGDAKLLYSDGTNVTDLIPAAATSLRDYKDSVRFATTAAGTLSTDFADGETVDGLTLATGDRGLIKNQVTGAENGIYVVAASGAPTRAGDFDADDEVTAGAMVPVEEGTVNADKVFILTNDGSVTVGASGLTFAQLASSEQPDVWVDAALVDETTTLTTGTGKLERLQTFDGTLQEVIAFVSTQSSSGLVTVDINKGGTSVLSTKLSIDANEDSSLTAATSAVILTSTFEKGDVVAYDVDTAGTGAAGLKVYMRFTPIITESAVVLVDVDLVTTTGFAYRPNISNTFTDALGSSPVTTAGDLVALVTDSSSNGLDGTASGAQRPEWVSPVGLDFDGVGNVLSTAYGSLSAEGTYAAYCRLNLSSGTICPMGYTSNSSNRSFLLFVNGVASMGIGSISSVTFVDPNAIDHRSATDFISIVGVWDGGNAELYINGVSIATQAYSGTPATNNISVGRLGGVNNSPFDGEIRYALAVQRKLTPSEVTDLHAFWNA